MLLKALPPDAALWADMLAAEERAKKPTIDRLRERQAYYDRMAQEGGAA